MKTLFSTDQVHARDRFDYWHAVACSNLPDHDARPECRQTFHAEMQSEDLADVGLVLFEHSPIVVRHGRHHAGRVGPDELIICQQVAGTVAVEHNSRELVLGAGDMMLLDPRLPYASRFILNSKMLVLKVPGRELEARLGKSRDMICRHISGSQPENGLLSAFLAMLPAHVSNLGAAAKEIVKDQALDLFSVACAQMMDGQTPRVSSARSLFLLNLKAAIDARLADPALDAATVAAAAGVSVRYANVLLAKEGNSIMRLILAKRLARCRKALEDPFQAHRMISEIAYGWGFTDMTHFGRRFRAAYGMLPSDCREGLKRLPQLSRSL